MFLGNHCKFQWFWRDHCKFSMVFEETITIECFWAVWPLPSMVLRWFFDVATIAFNGFRWFRTIGQTMRWFRWIVVVYLKTCLCSRHPTLFGTNLRDLKKSSRQTALIRLFGFVCCNGVQCLWEKTPQPYHKRQLFADRISDNIFTKPTVLLTL